MNEQNAVLYKCPVCDTVVEMLEKVGLELICCGRAMAPLQAKTGQAAANGHLPVLYQAGRSLTVAVGAKSHPMVEDHRIIWIELSFGGRQLRQFLQAGQTPQATFELRPGRLDVTVRAYCNVHGLWQMAQTLHVPSLKGGAREVHLDVRKILRRRKIAAGLARSTG